MEPLKRIPNARVGTVDKFQGAASTGCHLLSDDLIARGCPARNGISLQPEPAQCRNVARSGLSDRCRQPASSGTRVPQSAANAAGECALPVRRNGSSCRDAIIHAKRRVPNYLWPKRRSLGSARVPACNFRRHAGKPCSARHRTPRARRAAVSRVPACCHVAAAMSRVPPREATSPRGQRG